MISFEGPDQYSQAGGLGVRAKELCRAFAAAGFQTTLYFVGDPSKPTVETVDKLRLVRFCQSVSRAHPAGVYDGERAKIEWMWHELPPLLLEGSVRATAEAGHVGSTGSRQGNHVGFESMDWRMLERAATVTTVSRYMKHLMWPHGVNPMVIPNGIPVEALKPVDAAAARLIGKAGHTPCLTFKIGRFSPDKRWHQSLDAIAELRARAMPARLLMRGGIEHFGDAVLSHAGQLGLEIADWDEPIVGPSDVAHSLEATGTAAIVNLRRFLPESVLPAISAASTAVLANSGHEPFGLVGLEAMAAGGVAVVGATGEEYARPYGNAIVVETAEGTELANALSGLVEPPDLSRRLRRAARRDAAGFAWPEIIDGFLERMRYIAARQHVA